MGVIMVNVDPVGEARRLGYRVRYVSHDVIKDYNACYNVIYDGKVVKPRAADVLGIPLNEIWISEKWRKYEKYILYHELAEIKYRAAGYGQDEAHILSELECISLWGNDPLWREFMIEKYISDIENMASEIVEEKIKQTIKLLQDQMGYECNSVSPDELFRYLLGDTPTGDTVSPGDILRNDYYFIHEIVEICELKKQGIQIEKDTIVKHYPEVYKAHIKALDIELSYAHRNNDLGWIISRLNTITSQLNYDISILENYTEPDNIEKLRKMINHVIKKYIEHTK